jgi:cardiolipin synthase A/B
MIFVSSWDVRQYREHHETNSLSGYDFLSELQVKKWPISESWLIDMIDHTQKRAWVAVYTFTLPSLREALLRAHKRGVDVGVIMEKFPFWNTSINRETRTFFEKNSIPFHESGEKQFAFMHAKYLLLDSEWIIETANWTRASFDSNREFFLRWSDSNIYRDLEHVFSEDFSGKIGIWKEDTLVVWPTNARERIFSFLTGTTSSIDVYAPSFSDAWLLIQLSQLCYEKKIIRILLADYKDETRPDYWSCIQVRLMKKPLHAKSIIRDKNAVFVGSFNYTKNSLENNREIGIFVSGEVAKSISQSFESDWKQSEVALR